MSRIASIAFALCLVSLTLACSITDASSSTDPQLPSPESNGETTPGSSGSTDTPPGTKPPGEEKGKDPPGEAKPMCPARTIVGPAGTSPVYARVDRTGTRVVYSVTRDIAGSPPKVIWEIYEEPLCGGTPKLLVSDVRSLSFAFDEQNRLVYFTQVLIPGLYVPQLVVRTGNGTHAPFLGGCTVSNDQKLFVDVSMDGKYALISRQQSDGDEAIHHIGANGTACGEQHASWSSGAFDGTWNIFHSATRLSWDGKRSLRAPQPDPNCVIGTNDHSNDLRIYDFTTKQATKATASSECTTMDAVAWLPDNKRFLMYHAGSIYLGEMGVTAAPKKIAQTSYGHRWIDVSPDGAYFTAGAYLAPMPALPK